MNHRVFQAHHIPVPRGSGGVGRWSGSSWPAETRRRLPTILPLPASSAPAGEEARRENIYKILIYVYMCVDVCSYSTYAFELMFPL